ncbi:MAG: hypothetical protein KC419_27235 [Anaerolineales bacterium]|nr:hypothetical protein [Anaerolineales bacterium]
MNQPIIVGARQSATILAQQTAVPPIASPGCHKSGEAVARHDRLPY